MNARMKFSAVRLVVAWVRVWLLISGFILIVVGLETASDFLKYGGVCLLFGLLLQLVSNVILPLFQPNTDGYAATVHQAGIQQFFQSIENPRTKTTQTLPEIIDRTSFNRRSEFEPVVRVYQLLTIAFVLTAASVALFFMHGAFPVYLFAIGLVIVYLLDGLFELRSKLFFFTQRVDIDSETEREVNQLVSDLAKEAGVQKPTVSFSNNPSFIAGAINPLLLRPTVYVSESIVDAPPHILEGILAHEVGHLRLDEEQYRMDKVIHAVTPVVLVLFASVGLTVWSAVACFIGLSVSMMVTRNYRIQNEYLADDIASELTEPEYVILGLVEFTEQNPFIGEPLPFGEELTEISDSHPPLHRRIERLASSNQTFN